MERSASTNGPATSAAPPPAGRERVLALYNADARRFLDAALGYLARARAAGDDDVEVALLAIGRLANLGLGVPARELLAPTDGWTAAGIDAAELRESLRGVPSGRVPWTDLAPTFEKSLRMLFESRPHLKANEAALRQPLDRWQLFRAADGHHHLSRVVPGEPRHWVPRLAMAPAAAGPRTTDPAAPPRPLLAYRILYSGPHAEHWTPTFRPGAEHWTPTSPPGGAEHWTPTFRPGAEHWTPTSPPGVPPGHWTPTSPAGAAAPAGGRPRDGQRTPTHLLPTYLLEPDWTALAVALHAADLTSWLADPGLLLFPGPRCEDELARFLEDTIDVEPPGRIVAAEADAGAAARLHHLCQRVRDDRLARQQAFIHRIDARDALRSPADHARRLMEHRGVVLGFSSRSTTMLQHSMRDICDALAELGYDARLVIETEAHRQINGLVISRLIAEHDPVLVVLINHVRTECAGTCGQVPMLTWVQDPVPSILSAETAGTLGPCDFLCGYYQETCVAEYGYPPERYFSTILPVSTRKFHDEPVEAADARRYECDLMYAGHLHATPEAHCAEWMARSDPRLHALLARLRDDVLTAHERGEHIHDASPLVRAAAADLGLALDAAIVARLARQFCARLFDIAFRLETLGWAADWAERSNRRLRVYGMGWSRHPRFSRFAEGPIEHGEPLRRAYRCARLVLQPLAAGFQHQRTYEGLASGSTVIGRYAPPSFNHLSMEAFSQTSRDGLPESAALVFPGLERVMFRTREEFETLCEHLLHDEPCRDRVRSEMREVVLRRFTYRAVVSDVIERIGTALRSQRAGGA